MTKPKQVPLQNQASLKGYAVHSVKENGRLQYQFELVEDLGSGCYLARFYSALTGLPTTHEIINLVELSRRHPNGAAMYQLHRSVGEASSWLECGAHALRG